LEIYLLATVPKIVSYIADYQIFIFDIFFYKEKKVMII